MAQNICEDPPLVSEDVPYEKVDNEALRLHNAKLEQELAHAEEDQKMKKRWSNLLGGYLIIFTLSMFGTLWCKELPESTLNFLITVGFAKVVGVVYVIVAHLFPKKPKN